MQILPNVKKSNGEAAAGVMAGCKRQAKSAGAAVKVHRPSEDHWVIVSGVPFSGQTHISTFPAGNHLPRPPPPPFLLHVLQPSCFWLMVSDLIAFIDLAALQQRPDELTGQKYPVMKWTGNGFPAFMFKKKKSFSVIRWTGHFDWT